MWRVTCYDWSATSNRSIEEKAERQIRGGEVILLHDGGHLKMGADRLHTVQATENLIRATMPRATNSLPFRRCSKNKRLPRAVVSDQRV